MKLIAVLIVGGLILALMRPVLNIKIDAHPLAWIFYFVCIELYGVVIWLNVK